MSLKTFEIEFSTSVQIEIDSKDTDEIIKASVEKLKKKLKKELRSGDIKKIFMAQISEK